MTELSGGDGGAGGGAGAGEGGGDGGAGGGVAAPEWLGSLPDELKGDATLSRYKSVEELARGHLETKRLASSKLALPAADAAPEAWDSLFEQLGRPKDAEGYGNLGLALPDGADDQTKAAHEAMVKGYAEHFLKAGLLPKQAEALAKADMDRIKAAQDEHYAKGDAEIAALKQELGGEYEAKKAAAQAAFKALGLPAQFADELDSKVGSGALLRGFMKIAEKIGEQPRVDGDGKPPIGGADPAQAQSRIDALMKDATWRERYNKGDAAAVAEYKSLLDAAKKAAGAA